ncbi:MAG: hypothetical protein V4584_06690, partial [Verrucomicrobiota bacterium]
AGAGSLKDRHQPSQDLFVKNFTSSEKSFVYQGFHPSKPIFQPRGKRLKILFQMTNNSPGNPSTGAGRMFRRTWHLRNSPAAAFSIPCDPIPLLQGRALPPQFQDRFQIHKSE